MTMINGREADYPVEPLFLRRWSPRAFDRSMISEGDLFTILEAARWAPSSFNIQPWRFLYARRDTADWKRFLELLIPFNRSWAESASILIFILSDTLVQGPGDAGPKPSHSHSFDAGAAWASLALQAVSMKMQAHAMLGVDFDRARAELRVPKRFRFEASVAIGRMTHGSTIPDRLGQREVPSGRKSLREFVAEGSFSDRIG